MNKKIALSVGIISGIAAALLVVQYAHATVMHSMGYNDGQTQANIDWGHIKLHVCAGGEGYCPTSCPQGHSQDYCMAYIFGYRDTILADATG